MPTNNKFHLGVVGVAVGEVILNHEGQTKVMYAWGFGHASNS